MGSEELEIRNSFSPKDVYQILKLCRDRGSNLRKADGIVGMVLMIKIQDLPGVGAW